MKAIVTGGAGFIGSHLVDLLIKEGHEVIVIDNLSSGQLSNIDLSRCTFYNLDIREKEKLVPHFLDAELLFHLAGIADVMPSFSNPGYYHDVNVTGTLSIMEAARGSKIKKIIYAASSSCYGNPGQIPTDEQAPILPPHPYGISKYLGEQLSLHLGKLYGIGVISLRLFNVFGPRAPVKGPYSSVLGIFLQQKKSGLPLTIVGDGTQRRDFIHVTDVAASFYAAAQSSLDQEVFNVGSGKDRSIKEIATLLSDNHTHLPPRPNEPLCSCANIQKIQKLLHWQPQVDFERALSTKA